MKTLKYSNGKPVRLHDRFIAPWWGTCTVEKFDRLNHSAVARNTQTGELFDMLGQPTFGESDLIERGGEKKPTARQQIAALEKVGFRFHSFGISRNREKRKTADTYTGDKLTPEMRAALMAEFPGWVNFGIASPEYAPEIRKAVVLFLVKRNPVPA